MNKIGDPKAPVKIVAYYPFNKDHLPAAEYVASLADKFPGKLYIEIYNINNGERFSTYIIQAPRGSGEISLNGAAARKAMVGDLLIIAAYSAYRDAELASYRPVVVLLDEHNRPKPMPVSKQGR